MKLTRRVGCAAVALAGLMLVASPVLAREKPAPEDVLKRALSHITTMADRCVAGSEKAADGAAARIAALLAEGERAKAVRLARVAVEGINGRAQICVREINAARSTAIPLARRAGATDEMLRRFNAAVQEQIQNVNDARAAAVAKVRAALGAGGPG